MRVKVLIKSFLLLFSGILIMGLNSAMSVTDTESESVTVFASALTTNALTDIGKIFVEKKMGNFISSFASASTLAKQIENGAPANIYVSANNKWMDYLEEKKIINRSSRFNILGNRIVLVVPTASNIKQVDIKAGFDLARLLGNGFLAMGDPDLTSAGVYGKESLENLGVWDKVNNKVARAKDVRAALMLVERGESPAGIVFATDAAITKKVRIVGTFPEESHSTILCSIALVAGRETPVARNFIKFLKTQEAKAVFEKYGFTVLKN